MGVSSGQVSRKRGNQGDAWMGMVCPRVLPVLRRGSQMASGPKLGWRSETRQGGSRAVKMDASDALSGALKRERPLEQRKKYGVERGGGLSEATCQSG